MRRKSHNNTALRFAPLIRVSTEKQEKRGESLADQKDQIEWYVSMLDGVIPKNCWEYVGQEHATPQWERQKLDQLLEDAGKNLWDAIIVCDPSRWSRDNAKSKKGLNVLKNNGKRFFVGTMEYDLYNPHHTFFLGMSTEMNEYSAAHQALNSIRNRIARAKKQYPACGKRPFGRRWNAAKVRWEIIPEKQKMVETIAKRYLKGESLEAIAQEYDLNYPHLLHILKDRCGPVWEQTFEVARFNIKETVTTTIPALLKPEVIKAIHAKAKVNRTYEKRDAKHPYLFGRGKIFCAACGGSLFGQANRHGKLYYRHNRRTKPKCSQFFNSMPADILEPAVMEHLFWLVGDRPAIEKAIQNARPDMKERKKLEAELRTLGEDLVRVKRSIDNVVRNVGKGLLTDKEIEAEMGKLRESKALKEGRKEKIITILSNMPTQADVDKVTLGLKNWLKRHSSKHLDKMSFKAKRQLVENVFNGDTPEGQPCGVYVRPHRKEKGNWIYELKGAFKGGTSTGLAPLDEEVRRIFRGTAEGGGVLSKSEKRDAYHCVRFK